MSLEAKLRLHLADKNASFRHDVDGFSLVASWREDAPHVLLASSTPIRAALVVDAFTLAQRERAHATLVHEAEPSKVARDAAARLGVMLLDAATLPEPPLAPVTEMLEAALAPLPGPADPASPPSLAPLAIEALVAVTPVVVEEPPMLVAHVEPPAAPAPAPAPEPVAVAPVVVAPAPVAVAPAFPPFEVSPPLPWSTPASEPTVTLAVLSDDERFAMPWNPRPPESDHEVVVSAPRRPIRPLEHPTTLPANWGLPWPRPQTPADGLALHDPKLWSAQDRVHAIREGLEAKGGSSFGAVPPTPSTWLKHIQGLSP